MAITSAVNSKALITVVIPVFNRRAELKRALDSLVAQTDPEFSVIVCDDGSSEDISGLVHGYQASLNLGYIRIENSGAPARPRNVAVSKAGSEWISFLDSDDWWFPERIQTIKPYLNNSADIVYHRLQAEDQAGKLPTILGHDIGPSDPLASMISRGNPFPTSATVVRRNQLMQLGGFDEALALASVEDFDAWLRLVAAGAKVHYVSSILGAYWQGGEHISTFNRDQYEKQKNVFLKQLNTLPAAYRPLALSHFSYLLGSYGLDLGLPDAIQYLQQVDRRQGFGRWIKSLIKRMFYCLRVKK